MKTGVQRGFTLVEVMISVLVSAVILEAIYTTLLLGRKAWDDYSNNIIPKEEIRRGLISMVSELREAKDPLIVADSHSTTINFEKPLIGTVSYSWSSIGGNANQIIRTSNDRQRVLAKDISSLSFDSPVNDEIIVSITGGKKQSFVLTEMIALRSRTGLFLQGQNEAIK